MPVNKATTASKRLPIALLLGVMFLIPWTVYMAFSLPDNFSAHNWSIAWVGFDIALIAVLSFATWAAYFRKQVLVAAAIVAATLLICDAWFDVIMSLGTKDQAISIATAFIVEIPLAVFFIVLARRIMRRTLGIFRALAGKDDEHFSIHEASLISGDSEKLLRKLRR